MALHRSGWKIWVCPKNPLSLVFHSVKSPPTNNLESHICRDWTLSKVSKHLNSKSVWRAPWLKLWLVISLRISHFNQWTVKHKYVVCCELVVSGGATLKLFQLFGQKPDIALLPGIYIRSSTLCAAGHPYNRNKTNSLGKSALPTGLQAKRRNNLQFHPSVALD